jgi:hypothetical protein
MDYRKHKMLNQKAAVEIGQSPKSFSSCIGLITAAETEKNAI